MALAEAEAADDGRDGNTEAEAAVSFWYLLVVSGQF